MKIEERIAGEVLRGLDKRRERRLKRLHEILVITGALAGIAAFVWMALSA